MEDVNTISQAPVNTTSTPKIIPTPVRIIAVLHYIAAALGALSCLLVAVFFSKGSFFAMSALSGLGLMILIPMLIFTFLSYFIGRGLYKGQNWARILLIVLGVISLIMSLFSLIKGVQLSMLISLLINLLITGYLLFDNKVKEAFRKSNS